VKYLLDTHLLLLAVSASQKFPAQARALIEEADSEFWFSVVSVWEVAIKAGLGRDADMMQPALLRSTLLASGLSELTIVSEHAIATVSLPGLHGDPFDRMLIAQASVEGMLLVTSDTLLGRYPGPVRLV
jgi:PIN domain nuclease of toxin-antitoxin system